MAVAQDHHESKAKLLDAALQMIRAHGYTATTIDDICKAAGLTKGSFFHHFKSKEELALAAADHFAAMATALFKTAPYHASTDPLERVLGYVDFRTAILKGDLADFTCLLGTMVQETYESHPAIRVVCEKHITEHAEVLAQDITQAKNKHAPDAPWTPQSLALFTQAVIQGAFILAKATHGPQVAADCLSHLRRYIVSQFPSARSKRRGNIQS